MATVDIIEAMFFDILGEAPSRTRESKKLRIKYTVRQTPAAVLALLNKL
jgi:hypothetical protein